MSTNSYKYIRIESETDKVITVRCLNKSKLQQAFKEAYQLSWGKFKTVEIRFEYICGLSEDLIINPRDTIRDALNDYKIKSILENPSRQLKNRTTRKPNEGNHG